MDERAEKMTDEVAHVLEVEPPPKYLKSKVYHLAKEKNGPTEVATNSRIVIEIVSIGIDSHLF